MKIAFLPSGVVPFHGKTLEERPLGGIETSVIRLAKALDAAGHSVTILTTFDNPLLTKPLYLPLRAMGDLGVVDVLIVVRELLPLFAGLQARKKYYWTGDSYDHLQHLGLGDKRVLNALDGFLAVSNWQADKICEVSGFPREKAFSIGNGIDLDLFQGQETRTPQRLIYSATPFRGLIHLLRLFPLIRDQVPGAELHIFSGFQVYQGVQMDVQALERQHAPLFEKLKSLPGCTVHGNVRQDILAREFMRSAVLAYPNTFEETGCITAMEAMAGGCPVVTTQKAALPEIVGDAGYVIPGEPGKQEYDRAFVQSVVKLISEPELWKAYSEKALRRASELTWEKTAEKLLRLIGGL